MSVNPSSSDNVPDRPLPIREEGVDKWWQQRHYRSNPFLWPDAADVESGELTNLFEDWYIDPEVSAVQQRLGMTPMLDRVTSLESRPLIVFAPGRSGKTFYRRWSVLQIEQPPNPKLALEITNLRGQIPDLDGVQASDLAYCIYRHLCKLCDHSPASTFEHLEHILDACDELVRRQNRGRCYVFLDDIDSLFGEGNANAEQNSGAVEAISALVNAVALQGGGRMLALRAFLPLYLQGRFSILLGARSRTSIQMRTIKWNTDHCQAIIEKRLDTFWMDGANTGINHLSRLLTPDARRGFELWLERQSYCLPGYTIQVFDELGRHAYQQGVPPNQTLDERFWFDFMDSERLCPAYPPEPGFQFKETRTKSRRTDFVLVTALPEERDAVLAKLPGWCKLPPSNEDIRTYFQAELPVIFSDGSTGTYHIIVMSLLGMGRVNAVTATADAIHRWHPRYVLLVGIAGGIAARHVAVGDLLISDQVVDYELQKITSEGPQIRWEVQHADPRLLNACINLLGDSWEGEVQSSRPGSGKPQRHVGPIASGDKVVAFGGVLAKYDAAWPKLIGVEMEAGGVATAVFQSSERPGFFMVRAVSDLADENKGTADVEKWRAYACNVAASFAVALLKNGPVPLRKRI
ncbi:MAG: 5'-methylthioadenosine/S-adenosylhomocysteine nucleosidase [Anaerolineae bacterium]